MTIKKITLSEADCAPYGLEKVEMSRLGRLVAIAGKNGAGKSRFLNLLLTVIADRGVNLSRLKGLNSEIIHLTNLIEKRANDANVRSWKTDLLDKQVWKHRILERADFDSDTPFQALRYVPKHLNLADPRNDPAKVLINKFAQATQADVESYAGICFPYIQQLQNRWWSATHPERSTDQVVKDEAKQSYERFNDLVKTLLGSTLSRSINDEAEIFGKPLAESGLSDGQKVILQLATAIHAQSGSLDNTIFILDELENHLHPSVTIEILEKLLQVTPTAQIWIATHSIPLLAYVLSVDPMALWFMEKNRIAHAGRRPERVLESLLGNETRIDQLHALTGLPAQLAAVNYAAESLLPPITVAAEDRDPQINQIVRILKDRFKEKKVCVLDFGAGKGRLLEGLVAPQSAVAKIEYFAYDEFHDDRSICQSAIAEKYGSSVGRYFSSDSEFFSEKDDGSIDVVVMCNVLHEITPNEWLRVFSSESLIRRALSDNGFLLIVEDERIPIGEKAHEYGFLVLDTPQIKTLFAIEEDDIKSGRFATDDYRSDGRLKAHLIAKPMLARLSNATRTQAIKGLEVAALTRVREIRRREPNYHAGQAHGFWTQQFANAHLYLQEH